MLPEFAYISYSVWYPGVSLVGQSFDVEGSVRLNALLCATGFREIEVAHRLYRAQVPAPEIFFRMSLPSTPVVDALVKVDGRERATLIRP